MATGAQRHERRADALSRERIIQAATEILDADGEAALTFRALAARLATGSGAIYWHVANKNELLAISTEQIIAETIAAGGDDAGGTESIRAVALGLFDTITAHPWVGAQLSSEPWQPATLRIMEGFGGRLPGMSEQERFNCASALVHYLLGLAAQYAAGARLLARNTDRRAFLATVAQRWAELDPAEFPSVRGMAAQLPEHDDREQFLAGIDLILAGIEQARRGARPGTPGQTGSPAAR